MRQRLVEMRWWYADRVRTVRRRMWSLVVHSDTTAVRFGLALTGALWCWTMALPGPSFSRPAYLWMAALAGENAQAKWAIAWGVYAGLKFWRVMTGVPRPRVALCVNAFGVLLFSGAAYSMVASAFERDWAFPFATASGLSCALASVWVLVRTQVNSETGWRND